MGVAVRKKPFFVKGVMWWMLSIIVLVVLSGLCEQKELSWLNLMFETFALVDVVAVPAIYLFLLREK